MEGYKCWNCHVLFNKEESEGCPICGDTKYIEKMCEFDPGLCHCANDKHESIKICPTCKKPVCPECNSHLVVSISRVTGYLQDVSGFNAGKLQEVRDRVRYDIGAR